MPVLTPDDFPRLRSQFAACFSIKDRPVPDLASTSASEQGIPELIVAHRALQLLELAEKL
jgi:hypothetical protein